MMSVVHQERSWSLKQGSAEPNMWLLDQEPDGLVLVHVDDILLCGPLWLVRAMTTTIEGVWKASKLQLLDVES